MNLFWHFCSPSALLSPSIIPFILLQFAVYDTKQYTFHNIYSSRFNDFSINELQTSSLRTYTDINLMLIYSHWRAWK